MANVTYHVGQVCLNGHKIHGRVDDEPQEGSAFCDQCGEKTIVECPNCREKLRGDGDMPGDFGTLRSAITFQVPTYCRECGEAFPWTKAKLAAAKELADELEELSPDEIGQLKRAVEELAKDTPKTEVAALRFKKLMKKVGAEGAGAMRSIIIDILSEAARKSVFNG